MRKLLLIPFLYLLIQTNSSAQQYASNWASIDSRPTPQWFTDAKFGIFIHWGLFSVPAWGPLPRDGANIYQCYAEWYWWRLKNPEDKAHKYFKEHHDKVYGSAFQYQDFVKDFKAEMFDPEEWAKILKSSGARYVVLTSKHHEGFTLWPSEQSWNWNSVDVGPHRDLAGDLTAAVRSQGLRMGFYYSLYEWFNPLYRHDVNRYVSEHMTPQMKDLVLKYEPDIFWTDGEWDHASETWRSTDFLAWLYNESPVGKKVVVNDRWGKETRGKHGGIYTTEYDLIHDENATQKRIDHPWEECRGIGSSFGYNKNESLEDYASSTDVIKILIEKVSRGGNLLLNIGPTSDGRIPVIMQQRLTDIGNWLNVNGEAIYETKPWAQAPEQKDPTVFYTAKGKDLYVIFTKYPAENFSVKGAAKPSTVELLGYKNRVTFSGATISPPKMSPAEIPCQHAWVFKMTNALK